MGTQEKPDDALRLITNFTLTDLGRAADAAVARGADVDMTDDQCARIRKACDVLRDCIPVPRDELARYKRALLVGMRDAGYPNRVAWDPNNQVADIMFLEAGLIFAGGDWTDAAHDFAKEQVAEK